MKFKPPFDDNNRMLNQNQKPVHKLVPQKLPSLTISANYYKNYTKANNPHQAILLPFHKYQNFSSQQNRPNTSITQLNKQINKIILKKKKKNLLFLASQVPNPPTHILQPRIPLLGAPRR